MALFFHSLVFLWISIFVKSSLAIDCYQCSGTDNKSPFECNEHLSDDTSLVPLSCDAVYGAVYCVKHTGRFEGGIGTKRFCSSLHLGNYCNYVKQPGDILEYRTCIHTCSGDGCNPGNRTKPLAITTIVGLFLAAISVNYLTLR